MDRRYPAVERMAADARRVRRVMDDAAARIEAACDEARSGADLDRRLRAALERTMVETIVGAAVAETIAKILPPKE